MGHRTTRPKAPLRACRLRRYVAPFAVLAWLADAPVLTQTGIAQVDRVIDDDTIRVQLDGARYTVRLTSVDTPETRHPTRGVEPHGPEAAAYTTARLTGATVRIDRHEQNRSAAYSRLYQTITNLDRTAERTNHRLQAIIKALKQRDKETIAIEARLRQTMIDRIGESAGRPRR